MLTRSRAFAVGLLTVVGCAGYPGAHRFGPNAAPPAPSVRSAPPLPPSIEALHEKADHEAPFDAAVAERHHLEALGRRERESGADSVATASSLVRVAHFYDRQCRFDQARPFVERAARILEARDAEALERADAHIARGYIELGARDYDAARAETRAGLSLLQGEDGDAARRAFSLYEIRVRAAHSLGDFRDEVMVLRSRFLLTTKHAEMEDWGVRALTELYDAYVKLGMNIEAAALATEHHFVSRSTSQAATAAVAEEPPPECVPLGKGHGAGYVQNSTPTLRRLLPYLRRCGVEHDAPVDGRVFLTLMLDEQGWVVNARAAASGVGIPALDCLLEAALNARFEPPIGGKATMFVPFGFAPR